MKTNNPLLAAFMGMAVLVSTVQSHAQSLIYGLTTTNSLVAFSSSGATAPGPILTGLGGGETAVAIDFRPFTGQLHVLTADGLNNGRLYTVNPVSGAASALTLVGALTNINSGVGMDFNPVALAGVNALRIITPARDNYRLTFSGTTATVNYDGKLNTTNVVSGTNAVACAYVNNRGGLPGAGGAGGTTLYVIEADTDTLYIQNPPNNGTLVDGKPLPPGFSAGTVAGFDIDTLNNRAYAIVAQGDGELVEINLSTGDVTFLNTIPPNIADLAVTLPVSIEPTLIYGLTATNTLVPFTTDSTNVGAVIPITGAGLGGRTFVAIDFRPFNGLLYALARDALNDDAGRLYTIDPITGAATELNTTGATFRLTNSVGMDFNPVAVSGANALRIVTGADQNFRLTFSGSTATVIQDLAINPGSADLMAAGYVNNRGGLPGAGGVGGTTLYVVDSVSDTLFIQNPPNNGTLATPKPLALDVDSTGGLDILTTTNRALALFSVSGTNGLYEVDLANGFANFIRPLPASLVDLAVPIPARITTVSNFPGTNVALVFGGGVGPFNVQKANVVNDPFCSITTVAGGPVTLGKDGPQGFYRVRDLANASITRFTASLSGAAAGNGSTGFGLGTLDLNGDVLTYDVAYTGLTGAPTAAHVHLPATTGGSAGVAFNLTPVGGLGTTGRYSASVTLTLAQKTAVLAGLAYFNIHTVASPGGEIRGQIMPVAQKVILSGVAERPAANTSPAFGVGALTIIGNELAFDISYQGLTAPATAAHFHAAADSAGTAGVIINLSAGFGTLGRAGTLAGRVTLTSTQYLAFADGKVYVNIHNANFPGGEIRGQVAPYIGELPFSADLTGAAEKPAAVSSPGSGFVESSLVGNTLSFTLAYQGLTSAITAAHIHGPAVSTLTAGVLIDLLPYHRGGYSTQGVFSGSVALTPAMLAALANGDLYMNLHTAVNPGGEIRGQLAPMVFPVLMNGAKEVGPVATPATAYGYVGLVGRQVSIGLHYRDLTGNNTAAHYHGPADPTVNAGVLFALPITTGNPWGFIFNSQTLSDANVAHFADGLVYVNIHSTTLPGGEIRGQVLP
jgi:Domain of unknown function (DUF4394)/CHRD domain